MIDGPLFGKSVECEPILRSLPEWFGIESAIVSYSTEIEHSPTFLAHRSGHTVGFLTLKIHSPFSAEIYAMGVRQPHQRQGIGQCLVQKAQEWLKQQGFEYLQVKTLGPSNDDQNYAKTRAFYSANGFRPLEELKQLWNEQNPCLILIKRI